jgi:hypothetical protein
MEEEALFAAADETCPCLLLPAEDADAFFFLQAQPMRGTSYALGADRRDTDTKPRSVFLRFFRERAPGNLYPTPVGRR